MKLNSVRPLIWVEDVKATIDYYTTVLGFDAGGNLENWAWGFVTKDEVEFMFAKAAEHFPYTGMYFSGSFYLNTDDVDGWWNRLKEKVEIFYPIEDFEHGMREFAIKDCNGYIIQFGQEHK